MTTLLKFIHLGTIAIWSGGLIVLPFLFWQRRDIKVGPELDRLHRLTRFVYVGMTSPAAFVAIGSGTALIFLQTTFLEWFSLKMVLLGKPHIDSNQFAQNLFTPGGLRQFLGETRIPIP
jgi:putative membrane protein